MADATFDHIAFQDRLTTRWMGRHLVARAEVESTNDVAWEVLASGLPDGTAVVADAQSRGRGRAGRVWHTAPGKGLALSVVLHPGCDRRQLGTMPLVAGLALACGLDALGVRAQLKWPNDLLVGERKLAGILCESRRVPVRASGEFSDAVVIGVGVNVGQSAGDFPPEGFASTPTSLAIEGHAWTREAVAAAFLNALEPRVILHAEGGCERVLEGWRARADFWGRPVTVHTPNGPVAGVARALDPQGGLVIALESGAEITIVAGDLEVAWPMGAG